ncbi:MAG TPA: hypothetical protein V6C85_38610 [Allocoleopsis sp.]
MLFFFVAWTSLITLCFVIGTAILGKVKDDCFERIGDRFIVAIWLGVVILCVSLLAVSLVLPLSPLVGTVVAASLAAVALQSPFTRTEIVALLSALSTRWILGFIVLELVVAASTAQVITYFDTGLYHFQVIQWLSQFKAVIGLALIHSRFGFTSSWFTLAAPFNAGIFEARIGALTGGFAFLLATFHFLISLTRILQNRELLEDWFLVISSFIYLPILNLTGMQVSPSPDLPLIILTVVATWAILILIKKRKGNHIINPTLIPLILASGAVTMKLSAIPLLVVSSFFYIFERRLSIQRIFFCSAIVCLLLLPMLGFGIITSGCPLYPSSLMCLDLPWSLGVQNAKEMSEVIQNWARWTGSTPANANDWNWLWHWLNSEKQATFLIILSILSTVGIARASNKNQVSGQNYVLALGGLGIAFMMYGAPSLRFGLGYLCVLPAFFLAAHCKIGSPGRAIAVLVISGVSNVWLGLSTTGLAILGATVISFLLIWFDLSKINHKFLLTVIFFLISIVPLRMFLASPNLQLHLLLPPQMQTPHPTEVLNRQVNDIKYIVLPHSSSQDQCWAAELPCTPGLSYENIELRDPERGIGGGFIRK